MDMECEKYKIAVSQKEGGKTMKKRVKGKKNKRFTAVAMVIAMTVAYSTSAFATATSNDVITGMNSLKAFFLGVVSIVGTIGAIKSLASLGTAVKDRDMGSTITAVFELLGSLIMAFGGVILGIMGLS